MEWITTVAAILCDIVRGKAEWTLRRACGTDIIQEAMRPIPRRLSLILPLVATVMLTLGGCQKADINNNDAVRDAVVRHLSARGDLGLGDLDIQVASAQFEGDTCRAEVQIVPKGQPAEAGMTMSYTLERGGDAWKVKPNPAEAGHGMQAPATPEATPTPGESPATPAPAGGTGPLPPGHPPVATQPTQPR